MSLFDRFTGSDDGSTGDPEDDEATSDAETDQTGPNFMPEKQRELYVTAYENKFDLSDSGTCRRCGTTLTPVKVGRLLASCQNEDCENHLRDAEITAAERFYERAGHPDDLAIDKQADAATDGGDGKRTALDGLKDAMGEEE